MAIINLTFEVHCFRPPWVISKHTKLHKNSSYRLFINNDLITERTWRWDNSTILKENLWLDLNPADSHVLKLEPLVLVPEQAQFSVYRIQSPDTKFILKSTSPTEVSIKFA